MINFKTQADKIIQAYLKCEIRPYDCCACFVGNLLNGSGDWINARDPFVRGVVRDDTPLGVMCTRKLVDAECEGFYTLEEIYQLEKVFMETGERHMTELAHYKLQWSEDSLFEAMVTTLEELKKIHIAKGEVIEEVCLEKRVVV